MSFRGKFRSRNNSNNYNSSYKNNYNDSTVTSNYNLNLDENEDIILDDTKLSLLKENKSIFDKLKNTRMRKVLKAINKAKFKKTMLESIIKADKNFENFTNEILTVLGFMKDNVVDIS